MIEAISSQLGGMPREGVIALLALISLQLLTQVVALIHLARRRTVPGERKWVWVLVILFGNLIGAMAYFALGRRPAARDSDPETGRETAGASGREALDRLYGATSGVAG